jgi:DNA polymerase III subunit gamma/tau
MSYQVLARKWRPKSFDELVGQQQTATALSNALESQRLHHAYLFTGTRGVGKTTIARILSKSLNCDQGISANPCGECASCKEIDQGNFVDLMEIDAASKTKVEDTRELLDNVQYRPTRGRYKVYLIDEVHMLSGHSFNALLKTLEEPPPHVIFLLATTDPQKLPVTVLSRCLQFHLRRMEEPQIIEHLSKILESEGVEFEPAALQPIAKGADGSMRDALSLLDQAIAYSGESVGLAAVLEMLGSIDQNFCNRLLRTIQENDANAVMDLVAEMAQFSPDFIEVMSDWLNLLHRIAVVQATNDHTDAELTELAELVSPADLQLYYQLSLQAKKDLAYAPHPRQGFEMALLRVLAFRPKTTTQQTNQPPQANQSPLNSGAVKKKLSNSVSVHIESHSTSVNQLKTSIDNSLPDQNQSTLKQSNLNQPVAKHSAVCSPAASSVENSQTQPDSMIVSNEHSNLAQVHQLTPKISQSKAVEQQEPIIEEKRNKTEIELAVVGNNQNANNSNTETVELTQSLKNVEENSYSDTSACETNEQQPAEESVQKLPYHERPLYPDQITLSLEDVRQDNWHIVLDQMQFRGNGQQVLINSLGEYVDGKLQISYLQKVEHFLTDNLHQSLIEAIREYFNQSHLQIKFDSIETIAVSPKDRQVEVHQLALEKAYQDLASNSCVAKLQECIGASIDRSTIVLK